ncbi:MAG: response regulator [Proteobacteria bacterium]|nr:response regulator [Pseudomonadota bacterium]MBU1596305.1 response regulator [Pseudomonadota bacterium]
MASIIVLDDVADAAIMIKRILSRQGHAVEAFTEEQQAMDFVRQNPVDLAILDIKLLKMTGVEVLEEMRKISPDTKAIMLTGYPTLETARQALELGAKAYCVKPIDKDELEATVAAVLKA